MDAPFADFAVHQLLNWQLHSLQEMRWNAVKVTIYRIRWTSIYFYININHQQHIALRELHSYTL